MAVRTGNKSQGFHFMENTKARCRTKAKLITLLPAPQIYFWLCCVLSSSRERREDESAMTISSHLYSSDQEVANPLKG